NIKKAIFIIIYLLSFQQIFTQEPCYGNDSISSCCNDDINTDYYFPLNTERFDFGKLNVKLIEKV
ncbi:MAG: hypothetical protein MUE53_00905, partial [Chitinophagales bacterium]|nr:hypothetical protein [Chitinophagales bacterium]